METNLKTNLSYDIHITTVTPVHIGAGTEKKWIKGLDYFLEDKDEEIKFYNLSNLNLIDANTINTITLKILSSTNNQDKNIIKEIIETRNLNIKPLFTIKHNHEPNEIFAHIRNGFSIPYIPGSSIKGAIRSAILGYLYLYQNDSDIKSIGKSENTDKLLFGEKKEVYENGRKKIIDTHESIMRFIQVTDAHFSQDAMNLYNTKIYSLDHQLKGAWKDKRKGSKQEFDNSSFVSTYECIDCLNTSTFRINITKQIINLLKENKPKFTDKVIKLSNHTDPLIVLIEIFKMINKQTSFYLEKEIEFFDYHKGDKSDIVLDQLKSLKKIVAGFIKESNKNALLHLGSGSGFHGITGDWQFTTHIINGIGRNNRGQINNRDDAAKTRRLIFSKSREDDYVFTPMGFVVLSMKELIDENLITYFSRGQAQKVKEKKDEKIYNDAQTINSESQTSAKTPSPPQPYRGKIIQGQTIVPAVIVKSGKPNIVKLLMEGNELELPLTSYNSEIKEGTYIKVKITLYSKNQIKQVNYVSNYK